MKRDNLNDGQTLQGRHTQSDDFMVMHYRTINKRYIHEREAGERRLNIFLTIVSAATAGFIVLVTLERPVANVNQILILGLFALLALGVLTFDRICRRTVDCIRLLLAANHVRSYFVARDPSLNQHVDEHVISEASEGWRQSILLEGLAGTAALIDTFVAVAISVTLTYRVLDLKQWAIVVVAVVIAVLAWLGHALLRRWYLAPIRDSSS